MSAPRVVDPQATQDGRVQVVDVDAVFGGEVAQFVSGAVSEAALDAGKDN